MVSSERKGKKFMRCNLRGQKSDYASAPPHCEYHTHERSHKREELYKCSVDGCDYAAR